MFLAAGIGSDEITLPLQSRLPGDYRDREPVYAVYTRRCPQGEQELRFADEQEFAG